MGNGHQIWGMDIMLFFRSTHETKILTQRLFFNSEECVFAAVTTIQSHIGILIEIKNGYLTDHVVSLQFFFDVMVFTFFINNRKIYSLRKLILQRTTPFCEEPFNFLC